MGSNGSIAVGEQRLSWLRPGKSAVVGLVSAALGKLRTETDFHHGLNESLYFAVKIRHVGTASFDYHTSQTPIAKSNQVFLTRRDELQGSSKDLHTILSNREWRADCFYTVALWLTERATVALHEISSALKKPSLVLYLGRKSAPLGLPLNPTMFAASDLQSAFRMQKLNEVERWVLESLNVVSQCEIAFDLDAHGAPHPDRVVTRRDNLRSRSNWTFDDRSEGIIVDSQFDDD